MIVRLVAYAAVMFVSLGAASIAVAQTDVAGIDKQTRADLEKRAAAAEKAYDAACAESQAGVETHLEVVYGWSKRWMESEMDLQTDPANG